MEHSKKLAHATLAGILSLAAVHDDALAQTDVQVKCYGVAAAGANSCGTKYSSCAGQIRAPKACYAWAVAADAAACTKQGGSVNKPVSGCVEPNPNAPTPSATSAAPVSPTLTTPAAAPVVARPAPAAASASAPAVTPSAPATDKSEPWSFLSFIKKWF